MRTAVKVVLAVLVLLLLLAYVLPIFLPPVGPYDRLHCVRWSVDITSGRRCYERYLFGLRISKRLEESQLSNLYRNLVGDPSLPEWRPVLTFSPPWSDYSPHHAYHGAFGAEHQLLLAFETTKFSEEAKRQAIRTFLRLLQEHRHDGPADDYAQAILELASRRDHTPVEAQDLPPPPQPEQ